MKLTRTVSIRIPQTLFEAIKQRAERENRTINNLIGTILKKELEKS